MSTLILRIMINALSLAAAVRLVDGITFTAPWWKMIMVGIVFGIVNALVKPIITIFSIPLIILSLGLFTFVINALMLWLTAALSGTFGLGLEIHGFWPALWGALIISIVSTFLNWITGIKRFHIHIDTGRKGEGD